MSNHSIINKESKFKLGPVLELSLITFYAFICPVYLCDISFLRHFSTKRFCLLWVFELFFFFFNSLGGNICMFLHGLLCVLYQPTPYFWEKWGAVDIEDLPLPASTKSGVTFKICNPHLVNLISGLRFVGSLCFPTFVGIFNNLFLVTIIYYLLTFETIWNLFT